MRFFFFLVYFSKAGFIRHLGNAPGINVQKTPFQNFSPFSHGFKMFECVWHLRRTVIYKKSSNFSWHGLRNLVGFSMSFDILIWSHIPWNTAESKNTLGLSTMHSWSKEMHRMEKIPKNLGRLWLAYTERQGDFTCYHSYLLTLGNLQGQNSA